MIFYFSATGNCKYVATRLAAATGDTAISIADCLRQGTFTFIAANNSRIGFVTPVYFWGLPTPVTDFIARLRMAHTGQYVYHVLTFGTTTGQAHRMMAKALRAKGMPLDAKFAVQMVDTWTPVFNLTDTEKNLRILARAEPQIDTVAAQIAAGTAGDFGRRRIPLAQLYYATYPRQAQTNKFTVDDTCIGCGLCQRQCPTAAIQMKNGRPAWTQPHCAACLGCLHRCPAFAIQFGPHTRGHGQYTNPNIKL